MALPPDRITVKRRRDEEPVDSLYIPPKKTRRTFIWTRIQNLDEEQHDHFSHLQSNPGYEGPCQPKVPTVRTTSPKEDQVDERKARLILSHKPPLNSMGAVSSNELEPSSKYQESLLAKEKHQKPSPPKALRQFHLARTPAPLRLPSVAHGGIHKHKKKAQKEFAVFVESGKGKAASSLRPRSLTSSFNGQNGVGTTGDLAVLNQESQPRKRPLATAAERRWRTENWTNERAKSANFDKNTRQTDELSHVSDESIETSLEMASKLQDFALEVTQRAADLPGTPKIAKTKIRPRPPKERRMQEMESEMAGIIAEDVMDVSITRDDPDEFVYETYERQPEERINVTTVEPHALSSVDRDASKVGLLIITEEDQELWDMYGEEDQSSGAEWNSDEEDENAEDFYGNDYPEDELDSNDEYGRDTYKHWIGAFDEEDFADSIAWSDGEDDIKKPFV